MAGKKNAADGPVTPGKVIKPKKKRDPNAPDPRFDMTGPGTGEQAYAKNQGVFYGPGRASNYYDANKGAYEKPGKGEKVSGQMADDFKRGSQGESAGQDYWQGVNGKYGDGGPGYVSEAYSKFEQDVGQDAGLEAYYDAAFARTSQRLNRAAAARGQFNSSEAMRGQREAATALDAEQANREADYRLRRQQARMGSAQMASQDELGWTQGMGALAFQAADERLAYGQAAANMASNAQQMGQDRIAQGYQAAMGIDQYNVNAAATGIGLANDAQQMREGRIQGMFNNQLAIGDRMSNYYGGALQQDAAYAQQQLANQQGAATDQYNQQQQQMLQNQARQDAMTNMATNFIGNYPTQGGGNSTSTGSAGKNKAQP